MRIMLLHPDLICLLGEDQIHRVDCLPSRHTSGGTIAQSYLCLVGTGVDGENLEPLEAIEPRLYRWRISRLRVTKAVSGNEVGSPQIASHQIGMASVEAVDQDSRARDRPVPPLAHPELHQIAAGN